MALRWLPYSYLLMLWQDQAGQMQIKVVLIGWKSPPAALSLEGGGAGLKGCPALSEKEPVC